MSARDDIARRAREWYVEHSHIRGDSIETLTAILLSERDRALAEVEALLGREANDWRVFRGIALSEVRRLRAETKTGGG